MKSTKYPLTAGRKLPWTMDHGRLKVGELLNKTRRRHQKRQQQRGVAVHKQRTAQSIDFKVLVSETPGWRVIFEEQNGGGKEWWRKKWDQREVTEGRDEWNVLEELWLPVSTAGCSRWARGWNMQIHFQEMRQSVEMFLQNYALFALLLPRAFWRYQYHRDCRSVTNLGGDLASVP